MNNIAHIDDASNGGKRSRSPGHADTPEGDEHLAELAIDMPDTLAAIHALKKYLPKAGEIPPVILHHQL